MASHTTDNIRDLVKDAGMSGHPAGSEILWMK